MQAAQAKKALAKAFPYTVPVLMGYLFIGIAFGVLLKEQGFGPLWAILMSLSIYAGAMQFVALGFLNQPLDLLSVALMTFMVNIRHLFYGLAMLERYKGTGKFKPYLIFSLTDETFSLNCALETPRNVDGPLFFFFISLLNHLYWILGSLLGNLLGSFLTFDTQGIDFAMTALFVVLFVEQWKKNPRHGSALLGLGLSVFSLLIWGPKDFILPAMLLMIVALTLFRKPLEEKSHA